MKIWNVCRLSGEISELPMFLRGVEVKVTFLEKELSFSLRIQNISEGYLGQGKEQGQILPYTDMLNSDKAEAKMIVWLLFPTGLL